MKVAYRSQSGQIVLITLLVLSFALTVALSLIDRSTTDQSLTNQMEASAKAFAAAEAGIEEALRSNQSSSGVQVLTGGGQYQTTVTNLGSAVGIFEFPKATKAGATETIWLVNHNQTTGLLEETPTYTAPTINICWRQNTTTPALVTTILYKRGSNYYVAKGAYDPDSSRTSTNNFSGVTAQSGGCGQAAMYRRQLNFAGDFGINPATDMLIMLRVRPAYADSLLAVDSGAAVLPLQGKHITSEGTTGTGVTRKITVFSQFRAASSIFDAALYSQGTLVK